MTAHLRRRPTVLIGYGEAMASIEAAWNLRDNGFEVVVFARRRGPVCRVRGVKVHVLTAPEEDAAAAAAALRALAESVTPDVVMPLCDPSVWACNEAFADSPWLVAGPTGDNARLALDKRRQFAQAGVAGFSVARWWERGADDAGDIEPSPLPGPYFVKPAYAVHFADGRLCRAPGQFVRDDAEVRAVLRQNRCPYLVQTILEGVGEGVSGLAANGVVRAASGHRRIRMMNPRGSGASACRSVSIDADVLAAASTLLRTARWSGLFMIEMLRDPSGRLWFMELNGRAWGSISLPIRRGFDFPGWAATAALRPAFEPDVPSTPPDMVSRHLAGELLHLAFVRRGPTPGDDRPWPTMHQTVRDVLTIRRSDAWYNSRAGDRRVLLGETLATLRERLGRSR